LGGSRLVALAAACVVFGAAGCSSTPGHGELDPISAYFGPGGAPIPVLEQPSGRVVTGAPAAAAALKTNFPASAPGISAGNLSNVRDTVLRVLASLHADPKWLCGTWTGSDPIEAAFPPGTHWAHDPADDPYRKHQVLYQLPGCDQVRLVATYLGEQQFRVRVDPDNKKNIRVEHSGEFTYDARALDNGVRLPVHAVVHRTFIFAKRGTVWRLVRLQDASAQVAPGYGKSLPRYTGAVPGLREGNALGTADPAAMQAVRDALAGTISAPSAKVGYEDTSSAPWRLSAPDPRTGDVWPTRGLALYTYTSAKPKSARYLTREFVIDKAGDYNEFNKADEDGRRYTQFDPRQAPDVAGIPADSNPYVMLATLAQLDSASPAPCQAGDKSRTCYVAHIPVNRLAVAGTLTTRTGFAYASYGFTAIDLRVGVTDGKIAMVAQDAVMPVAGHGALNLHWRFTLDTAAGTATPPDLTPPPTTQVLELD
jgi:hypothetical protein